MAKRTSDSFPAVIGGGVILLALFFHSIYEDLLKATILRHLSAFMGIAEAELVSRLTEMAVPIIGAVAVIWIVLWYARRELRAELPDPLIEAQRQHTVALIAQTEALKSKPQSAEPSAPSPKLDLKIEGVFSGGTFAPEPNAATAAFIVTITNSGAMPSIARDWRLFAELDGVQYEALLMPLTGTQTLTTQAPALPGVRPERTVTYTAAESIFTKASSPISPGGMVQGILPALFRGGSPEKFRSGPKYTLICRDVLDRESRYSVETNSPGDIGYYPLINQTVK